MVEFENDRKVEKEAYAIINFFNLLNKAELASCSDLPENVFFIIGGLANTERLITDCKEKNIDIFTNSVGGLFQELEQKLEYLNSVTVSRSTLVEGANKNFEMLKAFYSAESGIQEEAYLDLATYPTIPSEKMLEVLKYRPKCKKIGER